MKNLLQVCPPTPRKTPMTIENMRKKKRKKAFPSKVAIALFQGLSSCNLQMIRRLAVVVD